MRLCSYTDHVKERYPLGYIRALNHKNPLDDTNIMSLTETVASGLEAINSVSFIFSNPPDLMNHKITIFFKYLYHVIDLEAFSTRSYVTPALKLSQAIENS